MDGLLAAMIPDVVQDMLYKTTNTTQNVLIYLAHTPGLCSFKAAKQNLCIMSEWFAAGREAWSLLAEGTKGIFTFMKVHITLRN